LLLAIECLLTDDFNFGWNPHRRISPEIGNEKSTVETQKEISRNSEMTISLRNLKLAKTGIGKCAALDCIDETWKIKRPKRITVRKHPRTNMAQL
jgi:hypothetical protein